MEHNNSHAPKAPHIQPAAVATQAPPAAPLFIQPRLTVGPVDDPHEREADAMADRVMRSAEPFAIQRKCAHCEEEEKAQRKPFFQPKAVATPAPVGSIQASSTGSAASAKASESVSQSIRSSAGHGQPMGTETRSFMESRFGADFSGVNIHADHQAAELSTQLQAKAFTVGNDIWFNNGAYQPHSSEGQHLLAHELTHTLQQGNTIRKKDDDKKKKDPNQTIEECMKDPDSILPGHGGALFHINRELMLEEMLGAERPAIEAAIRKDPVAHRFVCEFGVSGIVALVETSQGATFDVPAARKAIPEMFAKMAELKAKKQSPSQFFDKWRIADQRKAQLHNSADAVGSWADMEDKGSKDIPSPSGALNMPAAQVANIGAMINAVEQLKNSYSKLEPLILQGQTHLDALSAILKGLTPSRITDSYGSDVLTALSNTDTPLDELGKTIFSLSAGREDMSNVETALSNVKTKFRSIRDSAHTQVKVMLANGTPDFSSVRSEVNTLVRTEFKALRDAYRAATDPMPKIFKSADPLLFVLRYFKAFNDPKATPPTEADMQQYQASLDNIDMNLFFGEFSMSPGRNLLKDVIEFIKRQIAMRLQMKTATGTLPGMVPTLAEADAYFTTLNKRTISNDEARRAYTNFAEAWFQHRLVASLSDMQVDAVDDVFRMPPSIVGARSIVCSGYAQMGAALMLRAGATSVSFISAVRASDEQIRSGQISEGHAVARVTRQGRTFFVSNHLTATTEAEAMNVAWEFPDLPLITATGTTNKGSLDALSQALARRR